MSALVIALATLILANLQSIYQVSIEECRHRLTHCEETRSRLQQQSDEELGYFLLIVRGSQDARAFANAYGRFLKQELSKQPGGAGSRE